MFSDPQYDLGSKNGIRNIALILENGIDDLLNNPPDPLDKKVYINLEAPCAYCSTTSCNDEQEYFSHVYTLCPYTAEWMNKTSKTKFGTCVVFGKNIFSLLILAPLKF